MPPRGGPLPPQDANKQEAGPSKTLQYRDFSTGLVRAGSRSGIPDTALWDSLNAQVIGPGQLRTLPGPGDSIVTLSGVVSLWGVLLSFAWLVAVCQDGSIILINPTSGATTTICAAGVMSGSTRLTVWKDTHLLFIDPTKGYASWDQTTFVKYPATFTATLVNANSVITWTAGTPASALLPGMGVQAAHLPGGTTILSVVGNSVTLSQNATANISETVTVGTGAPTSGRDIAVFDARVWIVTGTRGIDFTGPGSFTTFETAYAGGATVLADPIFAGSITMLRAAIGLLWVVGPSAFNTISNVQVDATTGVTTFQNDNLVAGAGSVWADSVQALFRTIIFLTPTGVFAILGATPQKLSDALDGLFVDVRGLGTSPAGVFDLNNIRVYAVLVTIDGVTRLLIYSRPNWSVASADGIISITSLVRTDGEAQLWATNGTDVFQCFAGTTGSYDVAFKLFDYEAITRKKTIRRFLVEAEVSGTGEPDMDVYLENEMASILQDSSRLRHGFVWTNAAGQLVSWTNGAGAPFTWLSTGRVFIFGEAEFSGNLVSMRCKGTDSSPLTLNAFAWEVGASGEWVVSS